MFYKQNDHFLVFTTMVFNDESFSIDSEFVTTKVINDGYTGAFQVLCSTTTKTMKYVDNESM